MNFESKFDYNKNENKNLNKENDFIFNIENCDLRDDKTIEYLDSLKEDNPLEYFSLLEKLAELDFLKREGIKENDDFVELNEIYEKEDPAEEYYGRFNKFKNKKIEESKKVSKKSVMIPFNPYK